LFRYQRQASSPWSRFRIEEDIDGFMKPELPAILARVPDPVFQSRKNSGAQYLW